MLINKIKTLAFSLLFILTINAANAAILWQGNFETGDTSQWHDVLHPQGVTLTGECVFDGHFAAKLRITGKDAFLWQGNKELNRSELHHRRAAGNTYEGKDTFFAFSFYLPAKLSDNKHELGYWESDKTWQQSFRFNISGTELSFQQTAAKNVFWSLENGAEPGKWHRIALHIHWSTDTEKGSTEVWVDGKHMGKNYFKNLPAKDALMFTQIGFLRAQEKSVEEIFIDGALETDNLTELLERERHLIGKTCESN